MLYLQECNAVSELYEGLQSYFDFYHNEQLHQSLNYATPQALFTLLEPFLLSHKIPYFSTLLVWTMGSTLLHRYASFGFLQKPDDLLFGKTLLHIRLLL